ncbi:MAG TPA: hypothetical protein VF144_12495 [Chitinophagaceae bacterium]
MIRQFFIHFFFLFSLFYSKPIPAQDSLHIQWSTATELPAVPASTKHPGLAGAFIGIHNDVLLIAGGANFPNRMPWEGGKKVYHDKVYVLQKDKSGKLVWMDSGKSKLNTSIAYGASASTEHGVVCIGGENEHGLSKDVVLLQWIPGARKVSIKSLPPLPIAITNASVVANGRNIYAAGGETANGVSDKLFSLDLHKSTAGWKELPPVPKPLSHAVMVLQSNGLSENIYLVGGRRKTLKGISEFYNSVFEYDINKNEWKEKAALPYALAAGTGIAVQENGILVFGGDKGETFRKTEELVTLINSEKDDKKKKDLTLQKNRLQATHPGFSNEVLIYNTKQDEWKVFGKIPFPVAATTTAVKWNNVVIIPSGELKAGVRTPDILVGKFNNKSK